MKTTITIVVFVLISLFAGVISPIYSGCLAGGEGSSSCSYTHTEIRFAGLWVTEHTASVSCGEDSYACCNAGSANCISTASISSEILVCVP